MDKAVVIETKDRKAHGYNFALLQWRVVDGIEQCALKTLFRRTRQTSPAYRQVGLTSPPLQAMLAVIANA
jgi:hypothetical protein